MMVKSSGTSPRRRGLLTAAATASLLALAGCGSANVTDPAAPTPSAPAAPGAPAPAAPAPPAGGVPAPQPQTLAWAQTVCTSLNPVLDTLGAPPRINFNDVSATQRAFADYLGRAREVADKAIADVSAAGAPPVPAGQQAADQVRADLTRLRDNIADAQQRVAQLNTGDMGSVTAAFAAANNVVGSLGAGAQTLVGLDSEPQLQAALRQTEQCQRLMPAGGNPGPN
ncbi:MAG: hypothetical protein ACT4O0_02905 [Pseudonocardia sp.]